MASPGSKVLRRRLAWLRTAVFACIAVWLQVAHLVSEATQTADLFGSVSPCKWIGSEEAVDQVHGLQRYVSALAQHDLHSDDIAFASAALGTHEVGTADSESFLLNQGHAHALVASAPISWLRLLSPPPLLSSTPQRHRTPPLRGGAPAARPSQKQRPATKRGRPSASPTCPFHVDGRPCGKQPRRSASDGVRYCKAHASRVDNKCRPTGYQGCPFDLDGHRCGKQLKRSASDGVRYCDAHASRVERKSRHTGCPFVVNAKRCGKKARARASNGKRYCKAHAKAVDGKWCRLKAGVMHPLLKLPRLRRCFFKQSDPRNSHRCCEFHRCTRLVCPARGHGRFCDCHASDVAGHPVALMSIEEYTDAKVFPFRLRRMSAQCPQCQSVNFPEELIGEGPSAHFSICCSNGKVSHLPGVEPCPHALQALLLGTQ